MGVGSCRTPLIEVTDVLRFQYPRDDRGNVDHQLAVELVVFPPFLHLQHFDPPAGVLPLLANLSLHLLDVVPASRLGNRPLADDALRKQREGILQARI